jgi:hypothetical protein
MAYANQIGGLEHRSLSPNLAQRACTAHISFFVIGGKELNGVIYKTQNQESLAGACVLDIMRALHTLSAEDPSGGENISSSRWCFKDMQYNYGFTSPRPRPEISIHVAFLKGMRTIGIPRMAL